MRIATAECANILWKYVRRAGFPREDALRDIADLIALPFQPVSTAALLPGALALAVERGLSAYDACYATLAASLACPLITADRPMLEKLAGSGVDARWLGDVAP